MPTNKGGKKKAPLFYTEEDDLKPYGVLANDLMVTPLGLLAAVLGVKYARKEDKDSGCLWVQYRCEFQSPIEKELFEGYRKCSKAEHIWQEISKQEEVVQKNEEERSMIEGLNSRFQEKRRAQEAKNTKKKFS
ncbi:hypothetical protein O6H91_01G000600 [Diphasiastrum complanatum]|uniref:Uncharacterized protein n=1 Tax=Diphasiastrum complanatum TaxID=34168 RepID=A0ACC2EMM0_DIPCM|nr:hypothetical protein O6H91_01G000600 [Diphasiastrum complanatum]